MEKVEAGQLLALTRGEYSDYCLMDHAKALKGFDVAQERAAYVASRPDRRNMPGYPDASPDGFVAWLVARGLVEVTETGEVIEVYCDSPNFWSFST